MKWPSTQAAATLERIGFSDPQLEQVGSRIVINGDTAIEAETLKTWQKEGRSTSRTGP